MMAHCNRTFAQKTVYRSERNKVIAGVCGGMADHFGVSANWLRIGFVVGAAMTGGITIPLYVLCIFLMPREGHFTPPPIPKFARTEEAAEHVDASFDDIEERIRRLEDYVTSREYVLKRKFEEL